MKRKTELFTQSKAQWKLYFKKYNYQGRLLVNTKHRPQLKDHATLRKLVASGYFKIIREGLPWCRKTFLVLGDPVCKDLAHL